MEWKCTCSCAASEMAAPMNTKGSSRIQRRRVSVIGYKVSVRGYNVVNVLFPDDPLKRS